MAPFILMRSLKSFKWGDVYKPVLYPARYGNAPVTRAAVAGIAVGVGVAIRFALVAFAARYALVVYIVVTICIVAATAGVFATGIMWH